MEKQLGPNTQLGRYKLNSLLGIGGSSEVYRATDTELKRQVAIKCIHITTADKSATQSIEHEAALTAQLNHPNIVQLHDIVITDQVLGLVMEYVDGATLKETMKQTKPDQSQALDWLTQISKGLGHAHKSGIIHCDLKLDNVVLTKDNVVKIADFGIAKALLPVKTPGSIKFPEPTSSSQISGSAHAVSPEQAQGKQLDVRTDIFSFGILAYQLLTGRHPFGIDQDDQTIMQRIVHQPFEFSAADRISMPDTLLGLISALLEKKPTNRPKNMEAISARLQHILELTRSDTKEDDHTRLIPLITSVKFWQQPIIQWCAFAMLLTVITLSSWFLWPTNKPEPVYVALIDPVVTTSEEFDEDFKRQIVETLKRSVREGIMNLQHVNLIPESNLEPFNNSLKDFGRAVAADAILTLDANCNISQCQIHLQKLTGSKWNVQQETSWPTISSALLDLRHTTLSETYRLFGNSHRSNDNQPLDEQAYRNYLNVYKASNAGVNASLEHLEQLEAIQSRYHFIPLYQLYQVSAMDLYVNTNNAVYLDYAERFLNRAPKSIKMNTEFKRLEFNLLLLQDENDKAAQLIEELANLKVDRVLLNLLKVELAVRNNDYDTAVILERKNALLRPSLTKLYNLAVSEFSLGNIDLARQAINKALAIAPNDTDSYNMLGAIALTEGDIDQAIKSYTALVRREPDSYNLANLGLALMLNEDYTSAIGYLVRALEQNPDNPYFLLNLGDSYSLLGDQKSAQPYYQKVVDLDIDTRDATHYYSRAQAQAHLGQHYQAIKTLQSAKEVHSDTPDLAYSSAIVHAVAGNHSAAIVEVENAINTKMGTVWFNTKWFVDLCTYPNFINLFGREPPNICKTS